MTKRVLVIEDDASLCWLLERILKNSYNPIIMNSGLEALSWLSEGNLPDLIISDVSMPLLNGLELLENVRSSGLLRAIPIIILSGSDDPGKEKECLALGAALYIKKPFEPKFLLGEIEKTFKILEKTIVRK